jgi:hypothetical protein
LLADGELIVGDIVAPEIAIVDAHALFELIVFFLK